MKLFVSLDADGKVTAVCTRTSTDTPTEAEFEGPFYPDQLDGYKLQADETGTNWLVFDIAQYRKAQEQKAAEDARQAAETVRDSLTKEAVLLTATDEQAVEMALLYPLWQAGETYKAGRRLRFGDGGFCKVLQDHTSQADWLPDKTPSLYVVLADPAKEWPEFRQPTGAHDVYMAGDKTTYKGDHYTCKADNTAHSPEELPDAWEKAAE